MIAEDYLEIIENVSISESKKEILRFSSDDVNKLPILRTTKKDVK